MNFKLRWLTWEAHPSPLTPDLKKTGYVRPSIADARANFLMDTASLCSQVLQRSPVSPTMTIYFSPHPCPSARSQRYVWFVPSRYELWVSHWRTFTDPEIGLRLPAAHSIWILMVSRCQFVKWYPEGTSRCREEYSRPLETKYRPEK